MAQRDYLGNKPIKLTQARNLGGASRVAKGKNVEREQPATGTTSLVKEGHRLKQMENYAWRKDLGQNLGLLNLQPDNYQELIHADVLSPAHQEKVSLQEPQKVELMPIEDEHVRDEYVVQISARSEEVLFGESQKAGLVHIDDEEIQEFIKELPPAECEE
ncbi:unnamed protein product, partial [Strongylus vulgaris]